MIAWQARLRAVLRMNGATLRFEGDDATLAGIPRLDLADWGRTGDASLTIRLGRGVVIGTGVVIEASPRGTNVLELGDHTRVGDGARFHLNDGAIRLGPRCQVRNGAIVKSEGELVGEGDNILSYGVVVHCAESIRLGARTGTSERVSIVDSDHAIGTDDWHGAPVRTAPVDLAENVFLAANSVIMRGVSIGRGSVVASGAVVTAEQSFPERSLIAGVPAKRVKAL